VNLLAGTSGAGKSAFLAFLARQFRRSSSVLGVDLPLAPYLAYVGVGKSGGADWLEREDLDIPSYCLDDDAAFKKRKLRTKVDRIAILAECLAKVCPDARTFPPGSLVFVDAFSPFLGGNLLDHDACMVACMEVRELCQQMGRVALLGTMPAVKFKADRKQNYLRLQDHMLGSVALQSFSDTQMFLATPDENKSRFWKLLWTPRHAPAAIFDLKRDGEGRFVSGEDVPNTPNAVSWVVDAVASAVQGTLEFATLLKIAIERDCSRKTLQRLLNRELEAGRLVKTSHGVYRTAQP